MSERVSFIPVYGLRDTILGNEELGIPAQQHIQGHIYFAIDSGEIFLDTKNDRVKVGSSSAGASLFYSEQPTSEENPMPTVENHDDWYLLSAEYVNIGDATLKEDDLIIATDGAFYRFMTTDDNGDYICTRMVVSGSGGGGGGGAVTVKDLDVVINSNTIQAYSTLVYGQDYFIEVTATSDTDRYVTLSFLFTGADGYEYAFSDRATSGVAYKLNMNFLPVNSNVKMVVTAHADNSQMTRDPSKSVSNIKVVDMHVDKLAGSNYTPVQSGNLQLRYIPYGKGLGVQLHVAVDGDEIDHGVRLIEDNMENAQTVAIPKQSHGTHTIDIWLSAVVNRIELSSDPITFEASWADSEDDTPLVWVGDVEPLVVQYENAVIPYMVYSSTNERIGAKTSVDFYKNGSLVSSEDVRYSNDGWLYWDVTTLYDVGENEFMISCGATSKYINFSVTTEGSRDLSLTQQAALVMNFDSMGRSSTEIASTRNIWNSKNTATEYSAQLNNFNWYNNGWQDDKDGFGSYLSIANGASVTIPFGTIAMNTGASQWSFELRFRIKNAQKYATLVTEIPLYKYWVEVTGRDENGIANAGTLNDVGAEQTIDWIRENGYEVKLDSDGNMEMEESNTTRKIVETDNNVVMKYLNSNREGFCIGTQEAYFNTAGKTVNVRYKEGEIINIAFTIDKPNETLSIYLNGILSGAVNLSGIGTIVMENIPFLINSQFCDFDLYKFRIYNIALTMPEVIHNYLADIKNIALYDENQLTDVNDATKLSYTRLVQYNADHPDNLTMPYVLIDSSGTPADDELPHFKGGSKKVRIEFTNPTADKLLADGLISEYDYYTHCPSFTADDVDIDVQGTSSQKYPRRNFKTKFKKAKNWNYTQGSLAGEAVGSAHTLGDKELGKNWHEDNEFLSTNKFTWKIDYMESSGSYNTGFANLLGSGIYNKHPLDDIGFDASSKNYRTSVYGFPFLAFHKRADGSITYIGRYNFNLDKGSNEYYGFEDKYAQPYMTLTRTNEETGLEESYHPSVKDISECWELRDNQGTWCSFRYPNDAARSQGFMTPTADSTNENPKIEVAQHFEARYNVEGDAFETAQKYTTIDKDNNDWSEVIGGSTNAAICAYMNRKMANLKVLFDWLDSTDTTVLPLPENYRTLSSPVRMVVSSKLLKQIKNPNFVYEEYVLDPKNYGEQEYIYVPDEDAMLENGVTYEDVVENSVERTYGTFTKDSKEYRRQKFRNEFDKHLDRHYCTIYFIMTELLLCYDSRGKNMMIASFGPTANSDGNFVWYPIFYDIDTQLGLNNVGALLWDYDEDSTENKTFSTGDSVLWTNFADLFHNEIVATYRGLRQVKVTYNTIEGAYTCNPDVFTESYAMRGKRPIVAIGLDEYYKYVLPVTEPWKMQDGTYGRANYLYACQGDRILSRELLIENRLLYMDSKWHSGRFSIEQTMNQVAFRVSGNDPAKTSDKYLDNSTHSASQVEATYPVPYYDANPIYKITPYLNFYITWFTDENTFANTEAYSAIKYPDGMDTIVSEAVLEGFKSGTVDEQLNYFAGGDYISSFGDLSTKYPTEVAWPQGSKLLDIRLGSDAPDYFNNKLKVANFDLGTGANSNEKPLLQKILLNHLRNFDTFLDVTNPKKLREFRALDTKLKYALFADGAPLTVVHLPSSVTRLKFIENKNLTRILRSTPVVADMVNGELVYRNESDYAGLYVEGLTDYVNGNAIKAEDLGEIEFEGDALKYDSYVILKNAVDIKAPTSGRLKIRMDNINWSPYIQVEYGEPKQEGVQYYYATDHSTYEEYDRVGSWSSDTLNGKVYTFDSSAPKNTIESLELFDMFINDYETAVDEQRINQFTNNNESMATYATVPTITGTIFIANANGTPIAEDELTNTYSAYWPNLTIRAENVLESYIAKFVQVLEGGKEDEIDVLRFSPVAFDGQHPTVTNKLPNKTNYTFKGWALDADGTQMVYNYNLLTQQLEPTSLVDSAAFTFSSQNTVITLYAIFALREFGVKFYNGDGSLLVEDPEHPVYYVTGLNTQEQVTMLVPYRTILPMPKALPYKDDSALAYDRTYCLLGWVTSPVDPANNVATIDTQFDLANIDNKSVTSNLVYYPIFMEDDVHNNVLPEEYCILDANASIGIRNGYRVYGKITLPASVGGVTVKGLAGGSLEEQYTNGLCYNSEVTAIFWASGAVPEIIRPYACYAMTNLKWFEFPSSIKQIRQSAFWGLYTLMNRRFDHMHQLTWVDQAAFNGAFGLNTDSKYGDYNDGEAIYMPGSITTIGGTAFAYNTRITQFHMGSAVDPWVIESASGLDYNMFDGDSGTIIVYTNDENKQIWRDFENRLWEQNNGPTPLQIYDITKN